LVQWLTEGGDPVAEQRWHGGSLVTQVQQAQPRERRLEARSHQDLHTRRGELVSVAVTGDVAEIEEVHGGDDFPEEKTDWQGLGQMAYGPIL
jgi:hypothetical protein